MAQLVPIQLEDGTEIYIEATDDANLAPDVSASEDEPEEVVRGGQKGGWGSGGSRGFKDMPGGV
ncbi:MAG: hypothetical protein AAFY54_03140, partial [Cyanobacteria bacterium J06648_10]